VGKLELTITKRHLPHWWLTGSVYFVTFRVAGELLNTSERTLVLKHIRQGDGNFYTLVGCVIMPDHVHVVFAADLGYSLSRIMKGMKGTSSRIINVGRCSRGQVWQGESFDRIIRREKELFGKLSYMLHNPLKAGLAKTLSGYKWWYCNKKYFQQ
jgi:putative transposase